MIQTVKISDNEVIKLLSEEEGHFCDLKSIEISPGKLTKALAAFANSEGGDLYIGIEDAPRVWRGFSNVEAANAHLHGLPPENYKDGGSPQELFPGMLLQKIFSKSALLGILERYV